MSRRTAYRMTLIGLVLMGYIGLALVLWGIQWMLAPNRR